MRLIVKLHWSDCFRKHNLRCRSNELVAVDITMPYICVFQLFEQGLNTYTWRTEESADFIETANALVCVDLHTNLDVVQTNCQEIAIITTSWSQGTLDVFAARDAIISYTIEELIDEQM